MCERRFCKKNFLVPGEIPLAARSHRFFGNTLLKAGLALQGGQGLAAPIQNDCRYFCRCNGLDCLPVANGTTGAQRFFPALSHQVRARAFFSPLTANREKYREFCGNRPSTSISMPSRRAKINRFPEFPTQRNREFTKSYQGIFLTVTGNRAQWAESRSAFRDQRKNSSV